ncbi:MAG: tetratricopeptide repeat protein, partial [Acidobacteriota bacterium]
TTRRLAPGALLPDLRGTFSADPFVNRLYATALAALNDERGDRAEPFLRSVLALEEGSTEASVRLAQALNYQNRWREAEEIATALVDERGLSSKQRAAAYVSLSNSAFGRDDRQRAAEWAEEAIALARASDDRGAAADAHYALARSLRFADPARAAEHLAQAQGLHREIGNRLGEVKTIQLQGILLDESGDRAGATEHFTAALDIARELDAPRLQGVLFDSLALVSIQTGQVRVAVDLLEQALALHRKGKDRRASVFTHNNLGDCYQELGRLDDAEATLRAGDALCDELDTPEPCALLAFNFAELLLVTGRPDEALPLLERSEGFYGDSDPDNLWLRSMHLLYTGDDAAAAERLEAACAAAPAERCVGYRDGFADTRRAVRGAGPIVRGSNAGP